MAYQWDKEPPVFTPIKKELKEISETATTVIDSRSSPILGGFDQPLESTMLFDDGCFCCGKKDHGSMDCLDSPLTQCCYRGKLGHITFKWPILHHSPSTVSSENSTTDIVKAE